MSALAVRELATWIGARWRPVAVATVAVVAIWGLSIALLAIWARPVDYRAEARVLIVPSRSQGDIPVTSLDTLSRGSVVETFAQVFASSKIQRSAFLKAGFPGIGKNVSIETSVLSGTAIVRIVATAREAAVAERAADALAEYRPFLASYSAAFRPLAIAPAAGTAEPAGPSRTFLSVALIAAALVNALLVVFFVVRRRATPTDEQSAPRPHEAETTLTSVEAEPEPPRISAQR